MRHQNYVHYISFITHMRPSSVLPSILLGQIRLSYVDEATSLYKCQI